MKEGLKDLFDLSKTNTVCFCYTYATTHLLFIAKLLLSLWAPEIASVSWIWVSNYSRKPSPLAIFWSRENPLAYLTIITFKSGGKRCLFLINSFAPMKCIQHPSNHQCHPPRLPTRERQASNSGFWTCQRLLWFGKFQKNVGVDREPFKMVSFHEIPIDTWHGEDSSLHLSKGNSYTTGDQFFCRSDPMILQSTHWDSLREVFQHRFVRWWATRKKHCSFTPLKNQRLEPPVTTWNCCSTLEAKTPNLKIINSSSFVGFGGVMIYSA